MSRTTTYQEFELTARPRRLETGKWSTELLIRRNDVVKHFTGSGTSDTEDEAVVRSLDFGRKMIDGEVPEIDALWIS